MRTCLLAVIAIAVPGLATADTTLVFHLDGATATPPAMTPAFGDGVVTIDEATRRVTLSGTYHDLLADAFAAHIHGLLGGMPLLIGLDITGGRDGTLSLDETVSTAEIEEILSGETWVNVHTSAYPSGEIAGFIVVPEPASGLLILLAAPLVRSLARPGRRLRRHGA